MLVGIFRKSVEKIRVSLKSDNNNGYITRRPVQIFLIISRSCSKNENCFKHWTENKKIHFMFNTLFYRALYKMLKNTVEPDRPQMTWRMRLAYWIPEATNTHSEYTESS